MRVWKRLRERKEIFLIIFIVLVLLGVTLYGVISEYIEQKHMEYLASVADGSNGEELPVVTVNPIPVPTVSPLPDGNADDSSEVLQDSVEEASFENDVQFLKTHGIPIPMDGQGNVREVNIERLQNQENADIYAWIYLADTLIDYPILQHATDNAYYLEYNIDGTKGRSGCIYSENINAKDFSDSHTVLYGHNMRIGTMFAGLHKYEDSKFFQEHPYIYIYTDNRLLVYEVFASYEFSNTHLLGTYNTKTEEGFERYLNEISDVQSRVMNRREEAWPDSQSHILTLSTCVGGNSDCRYLVQGKLLNKDL